MYAVWIFDLVLLVVLVAYAFYGYRNGLIHSVSAFVGVIVGAIAAFFAIPLIGAWIPSPIWRVFAVLLAACLLVVAGQAAGLAIGRIIRRQVSKAKPLRIIDRVLGALLSLIATALVASLLSSSIPSLGVPILTSAVTNSKVLRVIHAVTPAPVETFLAELRSTIVRDGLPAIAEALGGVTTAPPLPQFTTSSAALNAAAQSVVRVTGTAYACNQSVSGSGFVVAANRVITNAHVVAGIENPVIDTPSGQALQGRVVYFDSSNDLAVVAVSGMRAPALALTTTLPRGSDAVVDGYPYGGPFQSAAAQVLSVQTDQVKDIYGQNSSEREIYTLATSVREGDSGGPVLSQNGKVAGVVFARSGTVNNVGYALTMNELSPVAAQASSLRTPVSSGACLR
jgi:S1-C subfamily serine protease